MIKYTYCSISSNEEIYLISIEEINDEMKQILDNFFVQICEWQSWTDLELVKNDFIDYLDRKGKSELKKWIISELFIHLFLNYKWFKQECLFMNLEENSIKKWFDWYYTLGKDEWLMESKSGSIQSKDTTHPKKIKAWYDDLKWKIWKKQANNPWKNAYHHAKHWDVNTDESIIKNIKKFSDNYRKGIYNKICDFNIIPASTIFLEWNWEEVNELELRKEIQNIITTMDYKKIIVICITKKSIDLIYDYLNK